MLNAKELKTNIEKFLNLDYGKTLNTAQNYEKYNAISKVIMSLIIENWNKTEEIYSNDKQAYYLSAEFLMGRSLGNNLMNLGIYDEIKSTLKELNININDIEEIEEDAALGNGGLGRLAACLMDSAATKNLPVTGYGIRYNYGLFKQSFEEGFQVEKIDNWLKYGYPWSIRKDADTVIVEFANEKVKAVPYDTPIIGYGTNNINKLRLFQAEPLIEFDLDLFNAQKYEEAVKNKNRAEDISRVLYPNDSTEEGKILRLKQQYFFVSASIKDLIRKFKKQHGNNFELFKEYNAIQLNDTHPVVAIPEFMRILVDEEKVGWQNAWDIVVNTFSYTNHTILREALEEWDIKLYKKVIPKVYKIITQISNRFNRELKKDNNNYEKINLMKIIYNKKIRMAWLAIYGTHATNGVAEIHTNILKYRELKDWYDLYPHRFLNKTNGITPRRWLLLCNRELSEFITELLQGNKWITDLQALKGLKKYVDNKNVLNKILNIKQIKKEQLSAYIKKHEGISINPHSLFDMQIKRLHEYKRQLLNAFCILDLYYRLKENPKMDIVPRTFIFGAKAASGYVRAKAIIKYINEVGKLINNDPLINDKIKVVFIQNYGVSYGEKLFPAADISEQISTAGKEASGTGNMKFMLNGTPTIGTYDGANVEIVEEAGEENNFIFGTRVEEIEKIKDTYNPKEYYETVPGLKRVVNTLIDGTFDDADTGVFKELYNSLLEGTKEHRPDNYFIFKDFDAYRKAQNEVDSSYKNRMDWARKMLMNIAGAGKFSSDRTIMEYSNEIWNIKSKKLN
ncbi:glycogen/starch/alpha-glucan phosphorylase [Clostridium sp. JS66]|uniref:glycogen/starch/alpha-glucan phosphorylase n=1 Tax=Clostridium sp. JS66 TaxID=3064705 RepID=UPI00298D72AC|nr:glycogen/starch/alpha-glucan phosphorylase [Clostridium sp. JS66]WPC41561.1 glycogen/starch/alpha-glucan phosphorylase [Clostridium sp. JS66]